ncbi:MAG TPA: PQQ-binding-like beta-propeller repeat protein [Blastocatellia bacterium]|nr:PQQ-binding-like beta-propeller repeat protein [Blastocatellia bacterium]HMY74728.1 PQQ-binding-like beta-propeller repeat protein [Blastocatellia bacterium]HMZ18247.1 PQQ-binding-like beta-propeller repeat protein [Blastocatellia bacterium]HNG33417.1 PQQ-binding-like beta-propeller repeat protein [Blastocatellia bacterium]
MKASAKFLLVGAVLLASVCFQKFTSTAQVQTGKDAPPDGAKLYEQRCAVCHDNAQDRTPPKSILARKAPDEVIAALTTGSMKTQANGLKELEIRAIAVYLTGKQPSGMIDPSQLANRCQAPGGPINLKAPGWNGWGKDLDSTRYQPQPGLKAEDVSRLKVKWAFAYPATMAIGQPTIIGNRLYVTTDSGQVINLNAQSGCAYWAINVGAPVRTAVSVGALPAGSGAKFAAYFGDERATVHAVDAETGKELWKIKLDDHIVARITGSPVLHGNRLYVPVSSIEEAISRPDKYECCKFRGSMAALDAVSGKLLWKSHTITEEPKPYKKNSAGTQLYGPAGAAVWSAPTLDPKRGVLYVGTGNSYTDVEEKGSDSIIAFELTTGKIRWANQVLPKDSFIMNCRQPGQGNCPENNGPDFDFGSSPILRKLPNGKDVILAGNKGGILFALDPDNQGKKLWEVRLSPGTALGGIEWGFTADAKTVYVPIADPFGTPDKRKPGLSAVDIATGKVLWQVPAPTVKCSWGTQRCSNAQSAAASLIPGAIFSGTSDGHLRAYATADGKILWDFDTAAQPYDAVNGKQAKGGTIDAGGATIASGMVYVNSGYGRILGMPGNALIAFSVDGK